MSFSYYNHYDICRALYGIDLNIHSDGGGDVHAVFSRYTQVFSVQESFKSEWTHKFS